jgi:hypothetical protein
MNVINEHFCIEPEVVEVCNLSHSHITKTAKYRVPSKEESNPLRTWLPENVFKPALPLNKTYDNEGNIVDITWGR